jgi:NAD(P)-dependent dehydrogenase (short-subunit alcohol dehydrogenase family)
MACPETRIGNMWESQFGINHIGHQLLLSELMNKFRADGDSRFISLSSSAHSISEIIWDDIHFMKHPYDKWTAYGQSKTASSLLAIEFDNKMRDEGVRSFAVHPGGILTPLQRHLENEEMVALGWKKEDGSISDLASKFFKSPTQGASTTIWCAVSPMLKDIGGVFCENCDIAKRKKLIDESQRRYFGVADHAIDSSEAKKLWVKTEEMIANS